MRQTSAIRKAMDDKERLDRGGSQATGGAEAHRNRAAQKLRENLMRRKQQARARRAGDADEAEGLPAAKKDESSGR